MAKSTEQRLCRNPKCGRVIVYRPRKFAWVHVSPGADHAPVP